MRCKVGDLVVIVRTAPEYDEYLGRIGTIVRVSHSYPGNWALDLESVDGAVITAADDCLRPIRDQPGEDEMLRIAGLPQELPADLIKREAERV